MPLCDHFKWYYFLKEHIHKSCEISSCIAIKSSVGTCNYNSGNNERGWKIGIQLLVNLYNICLSIIRLDSPKISNGVKWITLSYSFVPVFSLVCFFPEVKIKQALVLD